MRGAPPRRRLRPSRDPLGLRRALADRLLPGLVAAMALLAALAIAGGNAASGLAERWRAGAAAAVTVQLPAGAATERALAALRALPEVTEARAVDPARLRALLRPWLGEAATPEAMAALPLPALVELRLAQPPADAESAARLAERLAAAVPGAEAEAHGLWVARLAALAAALRAVAFAVLALVAAVAAAVVGVATRAGLAARRDSVLILHGLGATDGAIAGRFARRAALLAGLGAVLGAAAAVPVLAGLWRLAGPVLDGVVVAGAEGGGGGGGLPAMGEGAAIAAALAAVPWLPLAAVPVLAAAIGWATAQATVRRWLRRLP